jgi:hypothetical protein
MKLWILQPLETGKGTPWDPWYDKAFGFVVRAETEQQARELADGDAGDENRDKKHPWLDPKRSACEELTAKGDAALIMRDFASA